MTALALILAAATMLQATPFVVTLIVGHVIPIATALVTKSTASDGLKQFVTAFLSAASAPAIEPNASPTASAIGASFFVFIFGLLDLDLGY